MVRWLQESIQGPQSWIGPAGPTPAAWPPQSNFSLSHLLRPWTAPWVTHTTDLRNWPRSGSCARANIAVQYGRVLLKWPTSTGYTRRQCDSQINATCPAPSYIESNAGSSIHFHSCRHSVKRSVSTYPSPRGRAPSKEEGARCPLTHACKRTSRCSCHCLSLHRLGTVHLQSL